MNNKIELLKAMVNKPIKVEIKDNLSLVSKYYVYAVYAHSCVVTKDYISEYIKLLIEIVILKLLNMLILMELELQLNDIDYEDIYDNINDYEYPYNHINRSDL